jgi:hypothetical protein
VVKAMQLPSTAENSVSDTSMAVICGLAVSNRRVSSSQRWDSAARASGAALSTAIVIEPRKTRRLYKASLPITFGCCSQVVAAPSWRGAKGYAKRRGTLGSLFPLELKQVTGQLWALDVGVFLPAGTIF